MRIYEYLQKQLFEKITEFVVPIVLLKFKKHFYKTVLSDLTLSKFQSCSLPCSTQFQGSLITSFLTFVCELVLR